MWVLEQKTMSISCFHGVKTRAYCPFNGVMTQFHGWTRLCLFSWWAASAAAAWNNQLQWVVSASCEESTKFPSKCFPLCVGREDVRLVQVFFGMFVPGKGPLDTWNHAAHSWHRGSACRRLTEWSGYNASDKHGGRPSIQGRRTMTGGKTVDGLLKRSAEKWTWTEGLKFFKHKMTVSHATANILQNNTTRRQQRVQEAPQTPRRYQTSTTKKQRNNCKQRQETNRSVKD